MRRRLPGLLLVLLGIVALAVFGRDTPTAEVAQYSISAEGWMPAAPQPGALTESWFCPGVPASGSGGVEGEVIVANRGGEQLEGTVLVMNDGGDSRRLPLSIEPWATASLDLDETLPSEFVGAVVEIEGGGALVEQHALDPAGDSISACPNATSDEWFLADGYTVEGSLDQVILANPFEQTVVASLVFATEEGFREPGSYRGLTVPPRSIRVIDLGAPGAGAQSEPVLAVHVATRSGRLVVGRSQTFEGGGRQGAQVTVASPTARGQWWFADGEKGGGVDEEFVIYNPTDASVEVDAVPLGTEFPQPLDPILVPAREAVVVDTRSQAMVPEGKYAMVFATSTNEPAIVVEQVTTATVGDETGTGVLAGATARQDAYVPSTWFVPEGPADPTEAALVVHNVDNSEGTVSVSAVGRSGPVPVDSLQDIEYGPAQRIEIDLTDPLVVGRQLVIEATSRVWVERSFPNGHGDLRTPSWAIPLG